MRHWMLPLTAALTLALSACGPTTTPSTGTAPDLFTIGEAYIDPELVALNITAPANFSVTKMTIERDDTADGVDNYHLLTTLTSAPFTRQYTDTITTSGTYSYRITAYNAAGQTISTVQTLTAKVPTPLSTQAGKLVESTLNYPQAISAWNGGAGTVFLETTAVTPSTVSQTPVDASGNFTLDLTVAPTAAQRQSATVAAFLGANAAKCTGTAALTSNSPASMTLAHLRVAATKSGLAAPLLVLPPTTVNSVTNTKLALGSFVYVDQPVVITGTNTCKPDSTKPDIQVNFALHLYKGWNRVTAETVTDSAGNITTISWSYEFRDGTNNQWVVLSGLPTITP